MSYVVNIPMVKSWGSNRRWVCRAVVGLALVACAALPVQANVIAIHTWDTSPHNWTTMYGDANLGWNTSGGNPNGWMPITFPAIDPNTYPETGVEKWEDIIYVNKNDFFTGNFTPGMAIGLDFYVSSALPQNVQVQFGSTNGNVWGYNITPNITETQAWNTAEVSLSYSGAWGPLPAYDDTEEQFLADLAALDWIGIYIFREGPGTEVYGLDNFRLLVPEPGQMALLAAVLLGAGWKGRRRGDRAGPRVRAANRS